jgi:hypothetical protein
MDELHFAGWGMMPRGLLRGRKMGTLGMFFLVCFFWKFGGFSSEALSFLRFRIWDSALEISGIRAWNVLDGASTAG